MVAGVLEQQLVNIIIFVTSLEAMNELMTSILIINTVLEDVCGL